jgi:hypothetical protein
VARRLTPFVLEQINLMRAFKRSTARDFKIRPDQLAAPAAAAAAAAVGGAVVVDDEADTGGGRRKRAGTGIKPEKKKVKARQ